MMGQRCDNMIDDREKAFSRKEKEIDAKGWMTQKKQYT